MKERRKTTLTRPTDREMVITRVLDAPRPKVWRDGPIPTIGAMVGTERLLHHDTRDAVQRGWILATDDARARRP
jgi:hypothetical protein